MLKLGYLSPYRSKKDGSMRYLYEVIGAKADLKVYIDQQTASGYDPVDENGKVLYSSKNVLPTDTPLRQAESGSWFPDTSFWDIYSNLKSQYPHFSDEMIKGMMPKGVVAPNQKVIEETEDDLGKG
jgi:hypothetical protein